MASIVKRPNGHRWIQFVAADGSRKTVRLGRFSQRDAEEVRRRVEELLSSLIAGSPWSRSLAGWVSELPDGLATRLEGVGLIPKRAESRDVSVVDFATTYIEGRRDIGDGRRIVLYSCRRRLEGFFAGRLLHEVSPGDADDFKQWLLAKYAAATVAKTIKDAKMIFRSAVRKGIIESNPFEDVTAGQVANRDRLVFVPRETVYRVIDACSDAEWRLIVALARFGGLRCPTEILRLRWCDIDWDGNRMTVTCSKTRKSRPYRVVPLFPELRPHLEVAWETAKEGAEFVVMRYRSTAANLRTQLLRIMRRAGVEPWPRLFQNLRASCATELADRFPSHVCEEWLGHTEVVADRHYRRVTDEHFERAANPKHNPKQYMPEMGGNGLQREKTDSSEDCPKSVSCNRLQRKSLNDNDLGMTPTGLEPVLPA